MSGYAYFNGATWVENVTMKDIRSLASSGVITGTTLIRNPEGKEIEARLYGLDFSSPLSHGDSESSLKEDSVMAPAVSAIDVLYGLAVVGAVLSGVAFFVGIALVLSFDARHGGYMVLYISIPLFLECIITALFLVVLKSFVLCAASIEHTFRKMEENTRKEKE